MQETQTTTVGSAIAIRTLTSKRLFVGRVPLTVGLATGRTQIGTLPLVSHILYVRCTILLECFLNTAQSAISDCTAKTLPDAEDS